MAMTAFVVSAKPEGEGLKMLRFVKLSRFIRMATVLRSFRVFQRLEEHLEAILSDSFVLAKKTLYVVCGFALLKHIICCSWFAVGIFVDSDTDARWTDLFLESGKVYQYVSSFHWRAFFILNTFAARIVPPLSPPWFW